MRVSEIVKIAYRQSTYAACVLSKEALGVLYLGIEDAQAWPIKQADLHEQTHLFKQARPSTHLFPLN